MEIRSIDAALVRYLSFMLFQLYGPLRMDPRMHASCLTNRDHLINLIIGQTTIIATNPHHPCHDHNHAINRKDFMQTNPTLRKSPKAFNKAVLFKA
jgi:hypothetical protein